MKKILLLILLSNFCSSLFGQAQIWGVAPNGGTNGLGTIFYTDSAGNNFTKVYDFQTNYPGGSPLAHPVLASDSNLYGVVNEGGLYNLGGIYQYNPTTSTYSLLYNFSSNTGYQGVLTEYNNSGLLYGTCLGGGANNAGFIFSYNILNNIFTDVYDLTSSIHVGGNCILNYYSPNGKYYGVSNLGGISNSGIIFEFDPVANTVVKKIDFNNYDINPLLMVYPDGFLTLNPNNNLLIGTTYNVVGGSGTLFEFDPVNDTLYKKINLTTSTLLNTSSGPLLLYSDGKFYGQAHPCNTVNNGGLCNYDPNTHVATLKITYTSGSGHGGNNLIDGRNGKYYGTIMYGNTSGLGNLFEYDPSTNAIAIKCSFNNTSMGCNPIDAPTVLSSGKLIGILPTSVSLGLAYNGGYGGKGSMYSYIPSTSTFSIIVNFEAAPNGRYPSSSLVQASNGKLYGTTNEGGSTNLGTLYEFDPVTKVYTKKYDFNSTNGNVTGGRLVLGNDNKIYGVTSYGGVNNSGVIFQYDPVSNLYTKKYSLASSSTPNQFISLTEGNLIHGNAGGGPNATGYLYEYNITTNVYTTKKSQVPRSGTSVGLDNNIYGVGFNTISTGAFYKYDISANVYSTPKAFYGGMGNTYTTQMLRLPNGEFMSSYDYSSNQCALYKVNYFNTSAQSAIYILPSNINLYNAYAASFVLSNNSNIYGLCLYNGINSLFEYNINTHSFTTQYSCSSTDGILGNIPLTIINVNNPTITSQPPASLQICPGQSFTVSVAASGTNLKYQWYKNGTLLNGDTLNVLTNSSVVVSDSGYYSCLVSGNNGFTSSNVTHIVIYNYPNIIITAAQNPICQGNTTKLTTSGAYTYTWSTNAGSVNTNTVNVNPSVSTIYTVTGTNGICISPTGTTFTLNITPNPTVTVSAVSNPICYGQTFTLTANGATTYSWSVGSTTNTFTFSPGSTDTYSVTGTQNGCSSASSAITVTVIIPPTVNSIASLTVCANSNVSAINFSSNPAGATFNWTNSDTAIGIPANGSGNIASYIAHNVSTQHAGVITVIPTLSGCVGTSSTFTITSKPLPIINIVGNNTICLGATVTLTANGANTYTWNTSATGATITPSPTVTTNYTVTGSVGTCTSSATATVTIQNCIWPGDANENLIVDNTDLLSIGIKYGQTGPSRTTQGNIWQGDLCSNWSDTLSNGKNTKYTDCNGDGTVDMNDTLAVNLNYGLTHLARMGNQIIQTTNPDVYLQFNKPQYLPADTVKADVYIGSNINPQANFYGAAFTLNYDNTKAQNGTEKFWFNNSWIGNINQSKIKFSKLNTSAGIIDASLVRITHTDTTGFGKVATLQFVLTNTLTNSELYFTINNAIKTDSSGNISNLNSGTDSVTVVNGTTAINNLSKNQISIYPNPTSDLVAIHSSTELGTLTICNSLGEVVFQMRCKNTQEQIDVSKFSAGVYTVLVQGKYLKLIKE